MRTIKLKLKDAKSVMVLNSVLGQMSDGVWENEPFIEKYWENIKFTLDSGFVVAEVKEKSVWSYYKDKEIKQYFAYKIEEIILQEIRDGHHIHWERNSLDLSSYFHVGLTIKDIYKVYEELLKEK